LGLSIDLGLGLQAAGSVSTTFKITKPTTLEDQRVVYPWVSSSASSRITL